MLDKKFYKKIIDVEMSEKEHLFLGIKICLFLGMALLLKAYLVTPFDTLNGALTAVFFYQLF